MDGWTRQARPDQRPVHPLPRVFPSAGVVHVAVNLVSSADAFDDDNVIQFRLPSTFFFDADALDSLAQAIAPQAQVVPPQRITIGAKLYKDAVRKLGIHVIDDADPAHRVEGDTHFAFLVPERAFEDQAVLNALITNQVISARLAMCLLLVDFSNPVFSPERAQLLAYAPESRPRARLAQNSIRDSSRRFRPEKPPGSPEAQFLDLWNRQTSSRGPRNS